MAECTWTIEELAGKFDLRYWEITHEEALYLQKKYDVPIPMGMILSTLHDILCDVTDLKEDEEAL